MLVVALFFGPPSAWNIWSAPHASGSAQTAPQDLSDEQNSVNDHPPKTLGEIIGDWIPKATRAIIPNSSTIIYQAAPHIQNEINKNNPDTAISVENQQDAGRFAWIIHNTNYLGISLPTDNDLETRMLAESLSRLGFRVIYAKNLTTKDTENLIQTWNSNLLRNSVVLVYYRGLGSGVSGKTWLVGSGTNFSDKQNNSEHLFDLKLMLERLQYSRSGMNIVFLDFIMPDWDRTKNDPSGGTRSILSGSLSGAAYQAERLHSTAQSLNQLVSSGSVNQAKGTLIAHSLSKDWVRDVDPSSYPNNLYLQALLRWIEVPNLEIGELFRKVREEVQAATRGLQIPWETGSITGEFYFKRFNQVWTTYPVTDLQGTILENVDSLMKKNPLISDDDRLYWGSTQTLQTPQAKKQALLNYMVLFPQGGFVSQAEQQLKDLEIQNIQGVQDGSNPSTQQDWFPFDRPPALKRGTSVAPQPAQPEDIQDAAQQLDQETLIKIQQALHDIGLYNAEIHGRYDFPTQGAIYAFQQDRGFSPTGILTTSQIAILFADATTKKLVHHRDPKGTSTPGWYLVAMEHGQLGYVFGQLGNPDESKSSTEGDQQQDGKQSGADQTKGKQIKQPVPPLQPDPASTLALLHVAKKPKTLDPILNDLNHFEQPNLWSWASDEALIRSDDPELNKIYQHRAIYNVVTTTPVYKDRTLHSDVIGKLIEEDLVMVTGKMYNEEWYQILSPDGTIGYAPRHSLAPPLSEKLGKKIYQDPFIRSYDPDDEILDDPSRQNDIDPNAPESLMPDKTEDPAVTRRIRDFLDTRQDIPSWNISTIKSSPDEDRITYSSIATGAVHGLPDQDAPIIGRIDAGDIIRVVGPLPGQRWYQVESPDGVTGYVLSLYLEPDISKSSSP